MRDQKELCEAAGLDWQTWLEVERVSAQPAPVIEYDYGKLDAREWAALAAVCPPLTRKSQPDFRTTLNTLIAHGRGYPKIWSHMDNANAQRLRADKFAARGQFDHLLERLPSLGLSEERTRELTRICKTWIVNGAAKRGAANKGMGVKRRPKK